MSKVGRRGTDDTFAVLRSRKKGESIKPSPSPLSHLIFSLHTDDETDFLLMIEVQPKIKGISNREEGLLKPTARSLLREERGIHQFLNRLNVFSPVESVPLDSEVALHYPCFNLDEG